jgi:multidrug resistance protein, MATE family
MQINETPPPGALRAPPSPFGGGISRAPIATELRASLAIAMPLVAANLAQMAMGFTTTVMVGRLGGVPLAAAGLGGSLYFTIGITLQGVVTALAPLAAHALGSGDRDGAARIAGQGLALALIFALPFIAIIIMLDTVLLRLGYDPALAAEIRRYQHAIVWGAPAMLAFGALRSFLAAQAHTRPVMLVLFGGVAVNAALNWVFIYGHLGAPALGVVGAGYSTAANQWIMLAMLAGFFAASPVLGAARVLRGMLAWHWYDIAAILRLGLPIGGIFLLEIGAFVATGVLMGLIGADALAANQIVGNFTGFTFMVSFGLAQAATVRIAFECGAGRRDAAWRAAVVALTLAICFMLAAAIVLWIAPRVIIAIYIDMSAAENAAVVAIGVQLFAIAALFQVFDGMQAVAAGALRGYKDTAVPMVLAGVGYWGFGFLGSWVLAFSLGYGAPGLWWGMAIGTAVVGVLLTLRLYRVGAPAAVSFTRPIGR